MHRVQFHGYTFKFRPPIFMARTPTGRGRSIWGYLLLFIVIALSIYIILALCFDRTFFVLGAAQTQEKKGGERTIYALEEGCSPKPLAACTENLSWSFRAAAMTEKGLWFPTCFEPAWKIFLSDIMWGFSLWYANSCWMKVSVPSSLGFSWSESNSKELDSEIMLALLHLSLGIQ